MTYSHRSLSKASSTESDNASATITATTMAQAAKARNPSPEAALLHNHVPPMDSRATEATASRPITTGELGNHGVHAPSLAARASKIDSENATVITALVKEPRQRNATLETATDHPDSTDEMKLKEGLKNNIFGNASF